MVHDDTHGNRDLEREATRNILYGWNCRIDYRFGLSKFKLLHDMRREMHEPCVETVRLKRKTPISVKHNVLDDFKNDFKELQYVNLSVGGEHSFRVPKPSHVTFVHGKHVGVARLQQPRESRWNHYERNVEAIALHAGVVVNVTPVGVQEKHHLVIVPNFLQVGTQEPNQDAHDFFCHPSCFQLLHINVRRRRSDDLRKYCLSACVLVYQNYLWHFFLQGRLITNKASMRHACPPLSTVRPLYRLLLVLSLRYHVSISVAVESRHGSLVHVD